MVMGEMVTETDVLVIGAGPGGYVAAIRAAQLGKEVVLVDKAKLGGVCLHDGCIPSKALIHASAIVNEIQNAKEMGIEVSKTKVNAKQLQKWKQKVVDDLTNGIAALCKNLDIQVVQGTAVFEGPNKVKINDNPKWEAVEFKKCVVATGSVPTELPEMPFDGKFIISSNEALKLTEVPKNFVVIGAGYIGLELAVCYAKLGSNVTIVYHGDRLMRKMAKDVSEVISRRLKELNINVLLNTEVKAANKGSVTIMNKGKKSNLKADKVLVAVGRKPVTDTLKLERANIELTEKGFIKTNNKMQTSNQDIFAIGDIAGNPMLAHKASRQGKVAAEVIAKKPSAYDNLVCPAVMFTDPEIAYVGLDEAQAQKQGYETIVGKFPFKALGKAFTQNKKQGFIKLVIDKKTDLVLGCQIVGGNAGDMISEVSLAIEMGATAEDLSATIHPHPTFPEGIVEAAEAAKNAAIHIFNKK